MKLTTAMTDITPKEAIANLNHIYGMVAPDIQRSIDVAIKALENPTGDCISRSALKTELETYRHTRNYKSDEDEAQNALLDNVLEDIDNAEAIPLPNEQIAWEQGYEAGLAQGKAETRPQGEWIYDGRLCNWKCSECFETPKTIGYVGSRDFMNEHFKYCNHCGAKMKGGAE